MLLCMPAVVTVSLIGGFYPALIAAVVARLFDYYVPAIHAVDVVRGDALLTDRLSPVEHRFLRELSASWHGTT